jgi:hypothetical protein
MTSSTPPGGHRTTPTNSPATAAGSDPDARVIDIAAPARCWAHLRQTTEGVLSSRSARGSASLVVGYTVDDRQITIPIGSTDEAVHLLAGHEVTLSLTGHDDEGLRWVVRATGVAVLTPPALQTGTLAACRNSHPAHGAAARPKEALVVPVTRLRGYYQTPLDTDGEPDALQGCRSHDGGQAIS